MDPKKAAGLHYTANLVTPDNGEKYAIELENATLTNIKGFLAPKPDLTVTVNRADLNRVMMGVATFDQLADEGKARFEGDRTVDPQAARPDGHVHAGLRDPPGLAPSSARCRPGGRSRCRPMALTVTD